MAFVKDPVCPRSTSTSTAAMALTRSSNRNVAASGASAQPRGSERIVPIVDDADGAGPSSSDACNDRAVVHDALVVERNSSPLGAKLRLDEHSSSKEALNRASVLRFAASPSDVSELGLAPGGPRRAAAAKAKSKTFAGPPDEGDDETASADASPRSLIDAFQDVTATGDGPVVPPTGSALIASKNRRRAGVTTKKRSLVADEASEQGARSAQDGEEQTETSSPCGPKRIKNDASIALSRQDGEGNKAESCYQHRTRTRKGAKTSTPRQSSRKAKCPHSVDADATKGRMGNAARPISAKKLNSRRGASKKVANSIPDKRIDAPTTGGQWYRADKGKIKGPFNDATMRQWFLDGTLKNVPVSKNPRGPFQFAVFVKAAPFLPGTTMPTRRAPTKKGTKESSDKDEAKNTPCRSRKAKRSSSVDADAKEGRVVNIASRHPSSRKRAKKGARGSDGKAKRQRRRLNGSTPKRPQVNCPDDANKTVPIGKAPAGSGGTTKDIMGSLRSPISSDGYSNEVLADLPMRFEVMLRKERTTYRCEDYLSLVFQQQVKKQVASASATAWVNETWRERICEWSFQVVDHFRFNRETASISISLVDRFCSTRHVNRKIFQLAAMTAMYLAIKLNEPGTLKMSSLIELSRGYFMEEHIAAMEKAMLRSLLWMVHPPTPLTFVHHILLLLPRGSCTPAVRHDIIEFSRFLTELSVCDYFFVTRKPSSTAFASVLTAISGVHTAHFSKNSRKLFEDNVRIVASLDCNDDEVEECRARLSEMYCQGGYAQQQHEGVINVISPYVFTALPRQQQRQEQENDSGSGNGAAARAVAVSPDH